MPSGSPRHCVMMLRGMVASASSGNICPGVDRFLTLRMVSRDADHEQHPHGNDIRGGSIGMRQRTEMVGAGIANIDHIGLVQKS